MKKYFSLFKNKTSVQILTWMCGLYFVMPTLAAAETTITPCTPEEKAQQEKLCDEHFEGEKNSKKRFECKQNVFSICRGVTPPTTSNDGDDNRCKEAQSDFSKALDEFNSACAGARMSSSDSEYGCWNQVLSCQYCTGEDADLVDLDCSFSSDEDNPDSISDSLGVLKDIFGGKNPYAQKQGGQYIPDLGSSRNKFANCPVMASEDLDDWADRTNDAKDEMRDLEKEMPEMQDELNQLMSDRAAKMREFKLKAQELSRESELKAKKITEGLEDADQELAQQILKMEQQYREYEEAIDDARLRQQEAEIAHHDEVAKIEGECHAEAVKRVANMRLKKQADIQAGMTYGNMNFLMRQVGLNKKSKARELAQSFYKDCRSDKLTKDKIASARRRLSLVKKQTATTISRIRTRQKELLAQMKDARTNQRTLMRRRAFERLAFLAKDTSQQMHNLSEGREIAIQQATSQIQAAQQKMQIAGRHLAEVQNRVNQYQSYLTLKRKFSKGGISTEVGKLDETYSKYNQAFGAATDVMMACECQPCGGYGGDGSGRSQDCTKARSFVRKVTRARGESCETDSGSSSGGSTEGTLQ